MEKLREQNRVKIEQLQNDHNRELERLKSRFDTQTEYSLNSSTELLTKQSTNITELLSKWEESAFKIEQLQRSVLSHQESLTKPDMFESLNTKFNDIETEWKKFFTEYPNYVAKIDEKLNYEREKLFQNYQQRTENELLRLENDRKELEDGKVNFSKEVHEWRKKEANSLRIYQGQREKLQQDIVIFEERRKALESLYEERKKYQDEELKRTELHYKQTQNERKILEEERISLRAERKDIENERLKLNEIKQEFDSEKEHLSIIAQTLSTKASDLEKLSQVALKEKMDGMKSIEDAEIVQKEIQYNLDEIERSRIKILNDERRLAIERAKLTQNWKIIKQFTQNAVCNLCATSLNYGKTLISRIIFFSPLITIFLIFVCFLFCNSYKSHKYLNIKWTIIIITELSWSFGTKFNEY